MPILIVLGIILITVFFAPFTCAMSAALGIIWAYGQGRRSSELTRLEAQLYSDEVAAFRWSDDLTPVQFEERCAEAMRLAGWAAQTTKASGDQGVDVLAKRDHLTVVIQCKLYSSSVGNKAVQEAHAAKAFTSATHALVVTNSSYTKSAADLARATGVLLLHYTALARPNHLFGLPEAAVPHRVFAVTQQQIDSLRYSRKMPFSSFVTVGLFLVAVALDWSRLPTSNIEDTSQQSTVGPTVPSHSSQPTSDHCDFRMVGGCSTREILQSGALRLGHT